MILLKYYLKCLLKYNPLPRVSSPGLVCHQCLLYISAAFEMENIITFLMWSQNWLWLQFCGLIPKNLWGNRGWLIFLSCPSLTLHQKIDLSFASLWTHFLDKGGKVGTEIAKSSSNVIYNFTVGPNDFHELLMNSLVKLGAWKYPLNAASLLWLVFRTTDHRKLCVWLLSQFSYCKMCKRRQFFTYSGCYRVLGTWFSLATSVRKASWGAKLSILIWVTLAWMHI
jgi:hypothetical protein